MAEPTSVALAVAPLPTAGDIARAEKLVHERFLHEGEDPAVAGRLTRLKKEFDANHSRFKS